MFLLLLLGIILNWQWAWEPCTSVGRELANTLGERIYYFGKGVFVVIIILILAFIYFATY